MPSDCWKRSAIRRYTFSFLLACFYTTVTMRNLKTPDECQILIEKNDCNKNSQLLKEGQFRESFLKHSTIDTFEALCNIYRTWHYCNQTIEMKCNINAFKDVGRSKTTILSYCTSRKESFLGTLNCLKTQSVDNHLFNGCYVMMMLKTDTCKNRNELLKCEDKLVRSACGSVCADFRLAVAIETWLDDVEETPAYPSVFHLPTQNSPLVTDLLPSWTKLGELESDKERCLHQPQENPIDNSFEYTINCSPEFPEAMRLCYKDFFNSRVVFHPSLLAIVKSSVDSLYEWCNALGRYEECISPIQESCPEGVDQIYGVSFEWKKYYDVAVYICDTSDGAYMEHLPCFKKAISESSQPSFCRELFGKEPSDQYMYQLKCHSTDQNVTKAAFAQVDGLIKCYENFARKECSTYGRDAIYPLIRLHYSFDFLPLCFKPKVKTTTSPRTTRRYRFTRFSKFPKPSSTNDSSQGKVSHHPEDNRSTLISTQPQQVCICPTPPKNTPVQREVAARSFAAGPGSLRFFFNILVSSLIQTYSSSLSTF